ncbi:MAG TPA: PilT/PilU family type 4a pilus ATPase [Pseudomonadales bacterium]|jgi:twitching motility protein PilU|nr:PilT/PilU family type 4a pilus ATPase [Pseudomonadales bacterium]MDP6317440.1 PilT/PilU family type 4a pilus ATPase [Pseudomonadales bacterium]MDP7316365.1 PilT/PilU family type 4a pilus ATPase [Pseudomonadales bacterium]HJP50871.1 PilT/PilU family type 4a pilus ATPase [Pseudomonadales bacterium]|tara:strand:+ start:4351 stop:5622 length:1272 start_codon:yes stop_codon:yes gene_type:complete
MTEDFDLFVNFEENLKILVDKEGSDLYLSTGAPPSAKFYGTMNQLGDRVMQPGEVLQIANYCMTEGQVKEFAETLEMNLAISRQGLGRYRINIFQQRNEAAMVIRRLGDSLPNYKDLGLPAVLPKLIMSKLGLILFVGGTGSGKSTSMAALIDYRNQKTKGHIITIEDPVEFTHPHKNCIVNQREVGTDTHSWEDALANTLRQAPDVILIGEIRHQETMEHALAFAETGHLCLSTLHANNANQAMDRIINFFPEERHVQLLSDLALNMRGIISQRLIPTVDGKRAAAIEILLGTPRAADLISKGDVGSLKELMEKSAEQGMQTFDMALFKHYKAGRITLDEALKNADSKNNLRLKVTLDENPAAKKKAAEEAKASGKKPDAKAAKAKEAAVEKPPEEKKEQSVLADLSLAPMDDDEDGNPFNK